MSSSRSFEPKRSVAGRHHAYFSDTTMWPRSRDRVTAAMLASRAVDALDLSHEDAYRAGNDELPSRDEFLRLLGAFDGRAAGLLRVLLAKCKADSPVPDLLVVIEQIGRFIVAGPNIPAPGSHPAIARLELFVLALERIPAAQ